MTARTSPVSFRLLALSLLAGSALSMAAGCTYQRVVSAKGLGSERIPVEAVEFGTRAIERALESF